MKSVQCLAQSQVYGTETTHRTLTKLCHGACVSHHSLHYFVYKTQKGLRTELSYKNQNLHCLQVTHRKGKGGSVHAMETHEGEETRLHSFFSLGTSWR